MKFAVIGGAKLPYDIKCWCEFIGSFLGAKNFTLKTSRVFGLPFYFRNGIQAVNGKEEIIVCFNKKERYNLLLQDVDFVVCNVNSNATVLQIASNLHKPVYNLNDKTSLQQCKDTFKLFLKGEGWWVSE